MRTANFKISNPRVGLPRLEKSGAVKVSLSPSAPAPRGTFNELNFLITFCEEHHKIPPAESGGGDSPAFFFPSVIINLHKFCISLFRGRDIASARRGQIEKGAQLFQRRRFSGGFRSHLARSLSKVKSEFGPT